SARNKKFFAAGFITCMAVVLGAELLFPALMTGARGQLTAVPVSNTLYLATPSELGNSDVLDALLLDPSIAVSMSFNGSFGGHDCVVWDSARPLNSTEAAALVAFVQNGGGLLAIGSPALAANSSILVDLGILTTASASESSKLTIVDIPAATLSHPFAGKVEWNSIPEIVNYTVIQRGDLIATNTTVLLDRFLQVGEVGNKDPLLVEKRLGDGRVLFYAGHFGSADRDMNKQVRLWPYFNYVFYGSVLYLSGDEASIPTFGSWAYSPVPHANDQAMIAIYVTAMAAFAFAIFFIVRRRSRRVKLDEKTLAAAQVEVKKEDEVAIELDEAKRRRVKELMDSGMDPEAVYAELAKLAEVDLRDKWEQVGSHRQIGGFLFGLFMGIIVIVPQLVIFGYIFPQIVLPFPQVNGWMDMTKNFFGAIWTAFDVGTSVALAKYFAQYRVKQPEKAIHYIQIFVWWQMLSGVVQITIVALIGSIIFPPTYLAHMSWMFVVHSLIQYPGFFLVLQYVFQGMQRTDYQLVSQLLYTIIFNVLCQIACIVLFRWIFAPLPMYGEAFGAGIGFAIGQYFAEWGTFFFTVGLFKKLKFSLSTIFRADFTRAEFRETMRFGLKFVMGSVWVPAVWLFQMFLQSVFIKGYATENGYFNLVYTIGGIVAVVGLFMEGLLSGVSEAHSHGKKKLLELHTVQSLKWANYIAFFIVTLLLMLGPRFIIGFSGEDWLPAIKFIPWVLIFQLLGPYSWSGDKMLTGAGQTGKLAICWVIEQISRALLLLAFIPGFQMLGVLYAYIPALVAKNISLWIFIYRYVTRPKAYWLVVWISPAVSSIIVYFLFEYAIAPFVWQGDLISTALLFLVGLFGGLYLYAFLAGVFGHWDRNTIAELDKATRMVKVVGVLARSLYHASRAGYMVSPFKDKHPVDVFMDAMREAHELEIEKKVLKI
ncbi:MAG: lipopolysaccharide biosynthesis protein, partial [Candidatus Lokiarchaeota archaeon]|nr:lipopolysaccharide biosynthesis protein [Candidatus Lokiarchaeota archaeon]